MPGLLFAGCDNDSLVPAFVDGVVLAAATDLSATTITGEARLYPTCPTVENTTQPAASILPFTRF